MNGLTDILLIAGIIVTSMLIALLVVFYIRESRKPQQMKMGEQAIGSTLSVPKVPGELESQLMTPPTELGNNNPGGGKTTIIGGRVGSVVLPDLVIVRWSPDGQTVSCSVSVDVVQQMPNGVVTIGRADNQAICINEPSVSRCHLELGVDVMGYWIEDVGSSFGTLVNNRHCARRERVRLNAGDRIQLGENVMLSIDFAQS